MWEVWLVIALISLFILYKILMKSTQKERERMHEVIQEEKTKPKQKPKAIKIYSKGYVVHEIGSLYYKPESGYSAIGGLSVDDEKSFKMVVYDHKKKEHIGYVTDKRLLKTLEKYPEHLCYINVAEECKDSCNCYYCYNDIEQEYSVGLKTYLRLANEESHNIQEYSDNKIHKTKRKLNAYLKEVGLSDEAH